MDVTTDAYITNFRIVDRLIVVSMELANREQRIRFDFFDVRFLLFEILRENEKLSKDIYRVQ